MKRPKTGSTPKQYAYAVNRLAGGGRSKKEIALLSGFSPSVAENIKHKVEDTQGYQNAVLELSTKSNNVALAILSEYQARGLKEFSNKDLNAALNAIAGAWERFEKRRQPDKNKTEEGNPLRAVIMQRVKNQTINVAPEPKEPEAPQYEQPQPKKKEEPVPDLDF